jgi:hypothetical protein
MACVNVLKYNPQIIRPKIHTSSSSPPAMDPEGYRLVAFWALRPIIIHEKA